MTAEETLTYLPALSTDLKARTRSPTSTFICMVALVALVIAAVSVYLALSDLSSPTSLIVGLGATLASFTFATVCCVRADRRRSSARRAWVMMSVAMGFSTLSMVSYW